MARDKFDSSAGDKIAGAILEIEKQTNAEMVVVVRGRSGSYLHADYLFGAIVALIGLVFVLFSPIEFHTYWIPLDVIVLFIAGAWVSSRGSWIRRTFTTKKFRANAARVGASAMFYEAGIANTSAENGMLVYLSLLGVASLPTCFNSKTHWFHFKGGTAFRIPRSAITSRRRSSSDK